MDARVKPGHDKKALGPRLRGDDRRMEKTKAPPASRRGFARLTEDGVKSPS
jgi:hypothetical protein